MRTSIHEPFAPLLGSDDQCKQSSRAAYIKGSKRLFNEALTLYLGAMRRQNLLTKDDRRLILLAVHGLTRLNNYPLARALLQLSFSWLTRDELLKLLEEARYVQLDTEVTIPF